ncbi:GAF domain-containing protein [uncultured Roseobacter sp.]|uniref:GAF domain-containing protein n=1 Tax=uncultured Roseobacter sp. TaxID=114847 RepID=UPI0026329B13|nr:GAF domain-containing protein [uncultured Roseobacter sp.]
MTTSIKPDELLPKDGLRDAIQPGTPCRSTTSADRRAWLELGLLQRRMTQRFGVPRTFLFTINELSVVSARHADRPHPLWDDDLLRAQARCLAAHATTLHAGLAIDDIYAHPLVRPADILSGHRMRAFLAAPLRGPAREISGVICAADMVTRRWTGPDLDALQRIVAQFEALRLSQS